MEAWWVMGCISSRRRMREYLFLFKQFVWPVISMTLCTKSYKWKTIKQWSSIKKSINRIEAARAILLQLRKTKRSINCVWDEIQMFNPQVIPQTQFYIKCILKEKNLHLKEKSTRTLVKKTVLSLRDNLM